MDNYTKNERANLETKLLKIRYMYFILFFVQIEKPITRTEPKYNQHMRSSRAQVEIEK